MTKMERLSDPHVQLRIAVLAELMERRTANVTELARALGRASHLPIRRALSDLERYGNVERVERLGSEYWCVLPRDDDPRPVPLGRISDAIKCVACGDPLPANDAEVDDEGNSWCSECWEGSVTIRVVDGGSSDAHD